MTKNASSALIVLSLVGTASSTLAQRANPGAVVPDHYIVELRGGAAPAQVAARHGVVPNFVYDAAVNGFAALVPPGQLRGLLADPEVATVTPDREVEAIGKPTGGGSTTARQPQVLPAGVERIGANLRFGEVVASGIGVAVVDTGLDTAHSDLNVSPVSYSSISRATAKDDNGHGTHVGGIIAATNDGYDVVGVAPDATLYAVKVLNRSGSGTDSTVIAGLNWIAANHADVNPPIKVVNMSLGRTGSADDNPAYRSALAALTSAGVTVVVAAGNDCAADVSAMVPPCYPDVLAVASTTAANGSSAYRGFPGIPADSASYFTTDGAAVFISAPGEDREDVSNRGVISSVGILSTKLGGGTTRMSGTSMAAPHVAGVAALVYAADASASPATVRARLAATATGLTEVPLESPTSCYSVDGILEGVVSAAAAP